MIGTALSLTSASKHMTGDYQTPERMGLKLAAIPFPSFSGLRVLDVGCDHGHWSFHAARCGADRVVGLDRNREVRGRGLTNLIAQNAEIARSDYTLRACEFERINIGKQWREFGKFDLVMVMSVYHHIVEAAGGDHNAVWFWMWRHCAENATVLWEGPIDDSDPVVRANVSEANRLRFNRGTILSAAGQYFEIEHIGPALHEPTREVYRFTARQLETKFGNCQIQAGAGGATAAFEYEGGRRIAETEAVLGFRPLAGSLNVKMVSPFDWDSRYFRAQIMDVKDRSKGLASEWSPRWMRFYPVKIQDIHACAIRFEGEKYDSRFVELIAPYRLRDLISKPHAVIAN